VLQLHRLKIPCGDRLGIAVADATAPSSLLSKALAIQTLPKVRRPTVGVGRRDGSGSYAESNDQQDGH
jgi:hypothetical protein